MIKLATAGIVLVLAGLSGVAAAQQTHASAALSHPSPRLDRALAQRLAAAGPDSTLDVVVVLDQQAALPSSARKNRHARVRDVLDSLHATAAATQKPLLSLLRARQAAGRVASFEPLWVFNGFIVSAKPEVVRELAHRRDVREVRLSANVSAPALPLAAAAAESNLSAVNAPALWSLGYQGQGVVVANLDTGVDVRHPDLNAAWRGGADSWYDPNGEHPTTPTDVSGHGTWTMGVMVGGDRGGTAIGVAPAAKWIAAKIFNDHGVATTAKIHQAFQWLLDPDHDPSTADTPDVVNGSWTFGAPGCNLEFQLDLQSLRAAGILPVFAAGNSGPLAGSSYSPANNPGALSVGATDNAGGIASWSSRGPSACDGGVYPDVTAPGVNVTTSDLYGLYAAESGTSMAAPHVSGALALLLSRSPDLPADRQGSALEQSALDAGTAGPDNSFGYGRLDVLAAYNWLATAPDFTLGAAPASSTTAAGGQVSYTVTVTPLNGFAGDVSLSLTGLTSAQGSGSFTPALIPGGGGNARLDVTTSTSLGPGSYPLTIAATSGSTTHTVTVTLVVPAPPDFSLAISPVSASAAAGTSAGYAVAVGSLNGFAGDVALSLTGLSASQASWSFTPASVSGSGTSQLVITPAGSLAPGSYPLTITGISASISHSVGATLVVPAAPGFTLSASPLSVNTAPGGSAAFTVTVGALNGFTGNVGLSLSGLSVSQASWTFTPAGVAGSGSSQLLISTATTLAAGSYPLTITGSSGSTVHSASVTLTVGTTPDFSLAAAPASATVLRGGAVTYSLTVLRSGGFGGSVALSVSGLPFGSQASLSPNPVSGGASTLRVTTAFWTVRGTFTLTITGRSGALTRKATVKLVVS